ncbi:M23 family metallopeptidase [Cellulosimicrobium marinum]|uniref:M23 family metallopeptidase n=1 Tax=Cellulosimicrobium marinum TaxID=1638992 RepID=UPI001E3AD6CE|nr:M23 family metallopeptidase [Cellulosimicrobium marinum]MCB7137600.1 M23 family metallopeptidase [Cellulosimicrobium marinum]
MPDDVELALPFTGTWLVRNSPARRVPSHGTHLFATTWAIDFVAVEGRSAATVRDWRTALATEPPERFHAYGRPVLAPAPGTVVTAHDVEPDHRARRSPLALLGYALSQAARARGGAAALAGNHVVLALDVPGVFVVLAHLRAGSLGVRAGRRVVTGEELGRCGSSGNSTQPHVHVQTMDGPDGTTARGLPLTFRTFRETGRGGVVREVERGVPAEGAVVAPA